MSTGYNTALLEYNLPGYYKELFPFKPYVKWLTYGKKPLEYFARREFAFILEGDVHLRYKSFGDGFSFEKEMCKVNPQKLDLGAIYNHFPSEHRKHTDMQAVERELVFDIDLTDYDVVRTCCNEAKVCPKCWKFIVLAVKILDQILKEDFGFKSRMWVFSGRRGVHCWVGDECARKLNNHGRSAVAEYLNIFVRDRVEVTKGKPKFTWVPNLVRKAYNIAMESNVLEEMIVDQGWLDDGKAEHVFSIYKDLHQTARDDLISKYNEFVFRLKTPKHRWSLLKRYFDEQEMKKFPELARDRQQLQGRDKNFLKYFVLYHVYPRLDVNVSTGTNHLLKSPFCVHPKTGCIAVPLDAEGVAQFDVDKCPRIDLLLDELKDVKPATEAAVDDEEPDENEPKGTSSSRKFLGYRHTSLAPYVATFERFVDQAVCS